ncbi:MAG: hypothetical protein NC347_08165 [Clostridium sp.]|nr:hypothetical protein [Clostridium sp.]
MRKDYKNEYTNETGTTALTRTADNPQKITQIYDKTVKKILTLSSTAVVNLINGLFGTDYPPDSTITYNWTEFTNDKLKRILADTILTINGRNSYHIEAQMEKDETIIFRVFEYGYRHAETNRILEDATCILPFPEPKIIYLSENRNIPDWYTVRLDFGTQGSFDYTVSTFKYLDLSIKELNEKKMIILIPFQLLRFRNLMKQKRTPENLRALKNLVKNGIIESINENLRVGNITLEDALKLKQYTQTLYDYLYSHYYETEDFDDMTDESYMTDIDIICNGYEDALAAKDREWSEVLAAKDKEIARLKEQLARLQPQ